MARLFQIVAALAIAVPSWTANFSTGANALRFGTHEIAMKGTGDVANPFATVVTVEFTPPSGRRDARAVYAFYDGGATWKARVYVTEAGAWRWRSSSTDDSRLNGQSGAFQASTSPLRGMLKPHAKNPKAWMTDDGRWFPNISDTAYRLFHSADAPLWREFVKDAVDRGITSIRAASLGGWGGVTSARDDNDYWTWNDPWAGVPQPDYARFDLAKFRNSDERIAWLLDRYPDLQIQLILFSFRGYRTEGTGERWSSIPPELRVRTMRYMIARWAAFPNLFWLIVNDMHSDEKFPRNQAFAREVGTFFAANDPWRHLIASGANRRAGYPFANPQDLKWSSYLFIEDADAVGADAIVKYGFDAIPQHVFMGEDYYEQDQHQYKDPRYFFRWLNWSWLLSGGSANYAGRYGVVHPYSQATRPDLKWSILKPAAEFGGGRRPYDYSGKALVGLDSVAHIRSYLESRRIDLSGYRPNDALATDRNGRTGKLRPKVMERSENELIIYHPNAAASGDDAQVDATLTAALQVDLRSFPGTYRMEWFRALDGVPANGTPVSGGAIRELTAPWPGHDVVLRLTRRGDVAVK